jgi:starvation-inducible DNA-binding protein
MVTMRDRVVLYESHIDFDQTQRQGLVAMLNQQLVDTLDLKMQVKQAHWNVKGMQFIALHELFDGLATTLEGFSDLVAERVAALGGMAVGTARAVAEGSQLPEYDLQAVNGQEHLRALVGRYSQYGAQTRANIDRATALGDADTADLFTEISRQVDKDLWFLEAHLQG